MNDKRFLFRGFQPDENGKTTIMLSKASEQEIAEVKEKLDKALNDFNLVYASKLNHKWHSLKAARNIKIKGEWKYWTVLGDLVHGEKLEYSSGGTVSEIEILQETIGQWVTTDKNDKDIFDGDIVKAWIGDDVPMGVIVYDEQFFKYIVSINDGYDEMDIDEYEPIVCGNKWEVEYQ